MDRQSSEDKVTVRSTEISSVESDSRSERCLRGKIHLLTGMKLIVAIGVIAILAVFSFQILYFRRSIFVLLVPISVTAMTVFAMVKGHAKFVWPIIGISFFHIFISIYALIIFSFFFFIKPLYIIMVLNWMFDTTHPGKTLTYYASSLIVYFFLVCFGLFNAWQLSVSLALRRYLASQEKFSSFARVDMPAPTASVGMVTKSGDDHPCAV